MNFCSCFVHVESDFDKIWYSRCHKNLLSDCVFHENQHSERRDLEHK
jgi:hypothetical protein